jgi:hypothetical protein
MALTAPKFLGVQGVLGLSQVGRDQARDDRFIAAIRNEFPNVQNRQVLNHEAPIQAPHLILGSQSAQLSLSAAQADFGVQFYGAYVDDIEKALEFTEKKLLSVFNALESVGAGIWSIGLVAKIHFPDESGNPQAAPMHVLKTHSKLEVDSESLEDARVTIALRVRDTYFVHLTVSNYEIREFQQPVRPGILDMRLRPWEGTASETGINLDVDINNRFEARTAGGEPKVTADGVRAVVGMLKNIATDAGPKFADTGEIALESIVASSEAEAPQ